jgi:hypothetical protein
MMTKMSLRLAAFVFGLGVALPATSFAFVERQCWQPGHREWMCEPAPRPEWRDEHHRDWRPVPLHEERRWDHEHDRR